MQARVCSGGFSIGSMRNENVEGFHRLQKSITTDGGSRASKHQASHGLEKFDMDTLGFERQFTYQYIMSRSFLLGIALRVMKRERISLDLHEALRNHREEGAEGIVEDGFLDEMMDAFDESRDRVMTAWRHSARIKAPSVAQAPRPDHRAPPPLTGGDAPTAAAEPAAAGPKGRGQKRKAGSVGPYHGLVCADLEAECKKRHVSTPYVQQDMIVALEMADAEGLHRQIKAARGVGSAEPTVHERYKDLLAFLIETEVLELANQKVKAETAARKIEAPSP